MSYGLRIVVNGCFDLLHEGHEYLLGTALNYSQSGEVLVLINTNRSVCELKGEERPIDDYSLRKENIHHVCNEWCYKHRNYPVLRIDSFDCEIELLNKINTFAPHMIIKGNDRPDVRTIAGSENWPVLIIPRITNKYGQEISTTRKIQT